jgi:hypothetical protein
MHENNVLHADRQPLDARIHIVGLIAYGIELDSYFPLFHASGMDVAYIGTSKQNMHEV